MRRALGLGAALVAVAALVVAVRVVLRGPDATVPAGAPLTLAEVLGGAELGGYARADGPRAFAFPADHAAHDGFRTEWWYFTGNLDAAGRRVGFQLTLFRNRLVPPGAAPERASAFATEHAWMAHLALSDPDGGRFRAFERFAREGAGLAGATLDDGALRVWVEDWSIEAADTDRAPTFRVRAAQDGFGIDLVLAAAKPLVLQGEDGWSVKGDGPGDASYYYAVTRLEASGTVTLGGAERAATGTAWLDREWSTSALGESQVGWDWFALQLDDGRDLMLYELRLADGAVDATSHGALVADDGTKTALHPGDWTLGVLDTWTSPDSGARYPARWRVRVPAHDLDLEVVPVLADQELDVSVRYWEGAVDVLSGEGRVGRGYVELTGYADAAPGD